ncbi:discoidin domain-containing protein [Actinoplanes cyaneus]|uniref:discoidin domain-containing protein n=1 Tax=Actinoplanes cyaneus TaxID=52696 RepID=UPI00194117B4|nr:discoidin domain-containing protein [Actinoplanes cyaneus]MCW2135815.1 F5/8 type C domain-containing protein [Actinoplanes cyaneus]
MSRRITGALTAGVVAAVSGWMTLSPSPAQAATSNDTTCKTPVNGSPTTDVGPSATGYVLNVGSGGELGTVFTDGAQAAFPKVSARDEVNTDGTPRRTVTTTFSRGLDVGSDRTPPAQVTSTNGGQTFPASTLTQTPGVPTTQLRDGTLLGIDFIPTSTTTSSATFQVYRSTDGGTTWVTSPTIIQLGIPLDGGIRTHGAPFQLGDGTVLISYYIQFGGSHQAPGRYQQISSFVAASTDGGGSFTTRGTIAYDSTGANSYPEAAVAALPSGKLLSVVRHHVWNGTNFNELDTPRWTTSADGGVTWAALQNLAVSFPNGYDNYDDAKPELLGVFPQLQLMPNGVMVLSAGRPDNWVAISTNGQGTGWVGQLTYRNCPTTGYRFHGSTGNTALASVESNRVLQVGDNCDITWSCPAGDSGYTVDNGRRIWRRFADVLTPDVGKIDLATKYRLGQIQVSTDMTATPDGRPRTGPAGAFDGSTDYWSSAARTDGAGTYTITLDREYQLTRLGLSLRNGTLASGRVYASADGVNWGNPIVDAANRTHLALEYFTVTAKARYLKVEVDAGADGAAFLNELELYSTVNSFENDPVNNRPRGFNQLSQTWVTRSGVDGSSRALRLNDTATDAMAKAAWPVSTTSATRTLEFRANPVTLPNAFLFDVQGKAADGTTVDAYHFAARADGSLARYTGSAWVALTGAGAVPAGRWSTIKVQASTTSATVSVGGTVVATSVPPTKAGTTGLLGYSFASSGTAPVGDQVVFDDILFSS